MSLFSNLFRLRQRPSVDPRELAAYAELVQHTFGRAIQLHEAWFAEAALGRDEEDLANQAAIHRWEAAGLADGLRRVGPPAGFARAHQLLVEVLERMARAARLLSNGYRFHNASTRCDGQALLLDTAARLRRAQKLYEQQGLSVAPAASEASATPVGAQ